MCFKEAHDFSRREYHNPSYFSVIDITTLANDETTPLFRWVQPLVEAPFHL